MSGHRARKRFGQHFLRDGTVIDRLVRAINPQPDDHLVEIGPGLGALTGPLLTEAGRLEVVELDRDVIAPLRRRCEPLGELVIYNADALKFDFATLRQDDRPLRIAGNLPYNISTPLLFHLLTFADQIRDLHVMLQREVVDRMVAAPGDPAYGRLSVMLQYHCRVISLFDIGPGAFSPPPKVDSAVARLVPHSQPPVEVNDYQRFSELVRQAFSQRRKTLRNSLKNTLDSEAIQAAGIDPTARPETLGLEDFAALSRIAV